MKKFYTLFLLCLIGTICAWAETTTLAEYGTTNVPWTATNMANWTGKTLTLADDASYVSYTGTDNSDFSNSITIAPTKNSIVKLTAVWRGRSNTGRYWSNGCGIYFRYGNIVVAQNDQEKKHGYTLSGIANLSGVTTFTAGSYRVDIATLPWLLIEAEIDTATDSLKSFTVKSEDGATTYVSLSNVLLTSPDYTTVAFGFQRGASHSTQKQEQLKSLIITETTQDVTTVDYTINYIYNNDTIKTETGNSTVGSTISAVSPITIDNTKYYAQDGATTSMKLAANATSNVLNVNLRLAGTQTVNINAVDADNNVLKTFSGTRVEGDDAANLYYTRAVEYNGKYYTVPAANANGTNYGRSMKYGDANINITYTLDESITYYGEEVDLNKSRSYAAQGMVPERASGGDWQRLYANSHAYTPALGIGVYKIDISARNQRGAEETLQLMVRNSDGTLDESTAKTLTWASSSNTINTIENITVPEGASIAIVNNTEYNSNIGIDYLIAYKTDDLTEDITINNCGVSSYVTTYDLDFSDIEGLKALIATEETANEIVMEKVTTVPAGTAIIVRGTPGETYTVPAAASAEEITNNKLTHGALDVSTVSNTVYAISKTDGEFHPVDAGVTIPEGIAYLISDYEKSAATKRMTISGEETDEEPTAVNSITTHEKNTAGRTFNAAGQQVGTAYKGLTIDENGKKYIK